MNIELNPYQYEITYIVTKLSKSDLVVEIQNGDRESNEGEKNLKPRYAMSKFRGLANKLPDKNTRRPNLLTIEICMFASFITIHLS